jgi:hypothetical protein
MRHTPYRHGQIAHGIISIEIGVIVTAAVAVVIAVTIGIIGPSGVARADEHTRTVSPATIGAIA